MTLRRRRLPYGMSVVVYSILFFLPVLAFVALARAMDEESPWRQRDAIIFNGCLFCIGVALLAVLELVT